MKPYKKLFFAFVIIIASCSGAEEAGDEATGKMADERISISRDKMEDIGLELGVLRKETISEGILANGYLDTPPQQQATISSMISGRVSNIRFLPGDYVRKGQEILRLESPEFLDLQRDYLEVKSELSYLENEFQRQQTLDESKVNARKILLQAERDYHVKQAQMASLQGKLQLLDIDPGQLTSDKISPFLKIRAPINGYITRINTATASFAQTEDELASMVNPAHLHAELNVFEKDILKVKKGQRVEIILNQAPDAVFYGEVFLVGKDMDMEKRSINVHVHIPDNTNWVVGMYVEGRILTANKEALVIPVAGLVREENGSFVYVVAEEDQDNIYLKRIQVQTGTEYKDLVEISLPGNVPADVKLAIKGVYYLSAD